MLSRILLLATGMALAALPASPQDSSPRAKRLKTRVQDGGTLRLATGVWTPSYTPTGREVIYNNDAQQPFFLALDPGQEFADFGALPSSEVESLTGGASASKVVNGFEFAYATREIRGAFSYTLTFYDGQVPCTDIDEYSNEVARIVLDNLPGAERPGMQGAWRVMIDLRDSPYEFLLNEGEESAGSRFAWSVTYSNATHGSGGPLLAGDPFGAFGPPAAVGAGTDWHGDRGTPGTGLGTEDALWVRDLNDPSDGGECQSGVSNLPISYASFHMKLYADRHHAMTGDTGIGTNYCEGWAERVIWEDQFEAGHLGMNGGWSVNGGGAHVREDAARFGTYGLRLKGTTWAQKTYSTEGAVGGVILRYWRKTLGLESNNHLIVEWRKDGVWHNIETVPGFRDWTKQTIELPAEAMDRPFFTFRFRLLADLYDANDIAYIDNVALETDFGILGAFGSTSVADNDLTLRAHSVSPNVHGLFFYGPDVAYTPLGNGYRCVGGPLQRILPTVVTDPAGTASTRVDLLNGKHGAQIGAVAPITLNFQFWFRQNGSSNLTRATRVHFVE